ncbi:hypothetical protein ACWDKQ_33615 [Saccharopolyspora sp. NPDC000995]
MSNVELAVANGCRGFPQRAPLDAVLVSAASSNVPAAAG